MKKKCIIYCRVSTEEQAKKGYSFDEQEKRCRDFAQRNEYEVVKIFGAPGKSASKPGRKDLLHIFDYIKRNKNELDALIVWMWDRIARDTLERLQLYENLNEIGVRLLAVRGNNEDTPEGDLSRGIDAVLSKYEVDKIRQRTMMGMERRLRLGNWNHKAPFGYKNILDESENKIVVPTGDAKYMKEAFELMATGNYKQADIRKILAQKGCKMAKQTLNARLRNPIYAGLLKSKLCPEGIIGNHQPIITKETFDRVQAILDGKKPSISKRRKLNPEFPLSRFVRCHECGKPLSGTSPKGRNRRYQY